MGTPLIFVYVYTTAQHFFLYVEKNMGRCVKKKHCAVELGNEVALHITVHYCPRVCTCTYLFHAHRSV